MKIIRYLDTKGEIGHAVENGDGVFHQVKGNLAGSWRRLTKGRKYGKSYLP